VADGRVRACFQSQGTQDLRVRDSKREMIGSRPEADSVSLPSFSPSSPSHRIGKRVSASVAGIVIFVYKTLATSGGCAETLAFNASPSQRPESYRAPDRVTWRTAPSIRA